MRERTTYSAIAANQDYVTDMPCAHGFDVLLLCAYLITICVGSGLNFMSACIVVEEIAKVDPAVAVLVDIQNTLINNMLRYSHRVR